MPKSPTTLWVGALSSASPQKEGENWRLSSAMWSTIQLVMLNEISVKTLDTKVSNTH